MQEKRHKLHSILSNRKYSECAAARQRMRSGRVGERLYKKNKVHKELEREVGILKMKTYKGEKSRAQW